MVSPHSGEEARVPPSERRPAEVSRRTFLAGVGVGAGGLVGAAATPPQPAAAVTPSGYAMGYTQGYR